jgi:hypothetical protein
MIQDGLVLSLDASDRNSYVSGSTVWNDLSGNGNNGTLVNTPTFSSANGGSIGLNGTNQYLRAANLNNSPSSYMTLLMWVKHTGNGSLMWLGRSASDSDTEFGFQIASNKMLFWDWDNGFGVNFVSANTTLTTNTWNLLGLTKSTTSFTFYLNGVADGTTTAAKNAAYSSNDFIIGCDIRDNILFLPGTISAAMVYNRTLSASEVQQNYNALKSRFGIYT